MGTKKKRTKGKGFRAAASSPLVQGFGEVFQQITVAAAAEPRMLAAGTELHKQLGDVGVAIFGLELGFLTVRVGPKKAVALVRDLVHGVARLVGA